MKRNLVVGTLAALLAVLLVSAWMFLEMRYSEFGVTMRQWSANGGPTGRFDDTMGFLGKWVHIHQFILSPIVSILVGMFVGTLCRTRYWLALVIAVAPIVFINYPSDALSLMGGVIYILAAWLGVKSAQRIGKHFSKPNQQTVPA